MRHTISAIAVLATVAVLAAASPASAGAVPDQLDPHVDVTDAVFSQGTDGNAWVDLDLAGPWGDGSWVDDVFSFFISVDVSNADDSSGLIVQHHDGVWTVAGTYDAGGTTTETEPSLFILDSGGIRLNLGLLSADDLFFTAQSASMRTPDAPRIEGNQFAGPVNWSNPNLDPKLRALAEFNFPAGAFRAIENPLLPATGNTPPADASADDPTVKPDISSAPDTPAASSADSDAQALADDLDARAQDDLPASNGGEDGSNGARNFLIIAILVAFSIATGWILWRRNRGQSGRAGSDEPIDELSNDVPTDDEIKAKITAATKNLVEKNEIDLHAAPDETPPDLPKDTPTDPPEDPDDFIDRVL